MTSMAYNNEDLRELYRELILDHARSPRHFGKLPDATHSAEGINPLCGDKLKMYFRIDADNRIDGIPGTARASLALYNNMDDVDALIAGLGKAKELFAV